MGVEFKCPFCSDHLPRLRGYQSLTPLSKSGFKILKALHDVGAGAVLPHTDLLAALGLHPQHVANVVAVHISRLRKLLPPEIQVVTVRGVGFRLEVEGEENVVQI